MRFDLTSVWYRDQQRYLIIFLLPFSWLFSLATATRRFFYRLKWLRTHVFSVPVIVVGNITVGGTGKTPLVIELVHVLQRQGYSPGIISRGVGGRRHQKPYLVQCSDRVDKVGDEAILLAKKTSCPVVIGINRATAAHYLLKHSTCNVIISDDGLQHYRLGRHIEIAVVDGKRQFGNERLLPAGPLREPIKRLNQVDYVVVNGCAAHQYQYSLISTPLSSMTIEPIELVSISNQHITLPLSVLANKKVHAVAAIGHPERFFQLLKQYDLNIIPHVFPDHYIFQSNDLDFNDSLPVVMTEKDAVKCDIQNERYWFLKIAVKLDKKFQVDLLAQLRELFLKRCA